MDYAYSLYSHPSERPMSDIDILIPLAKAGAACSALKPEGFKCCTSGMGLFTSGVVGEFKFTRGGILLELHTHPLYYPSLLPGIIPSVGEFRETRVIRGRSAPGWVEGFLYTVLHHSDTRTLKDWQKRDIRLLSEKMNDGMWERLAFLSVRTGWGEKIAKVLENCSSGAPETVVRCLRSRVFRQDTRNMHGTAAAFRTLTGWRQLGFAWAVFHRILSGDVSRRKG